MSKANERIQLLTQQFNSMEDWESRYQHIINLGKQLPAMPAEGMVDENKVAGCQSQVWLLPCVGNGGVLHFKADSDALIVKGLISLLLFVYQDLTPSEILQVPSHFLKELGLEQHLSPSRSNGLRAMQKQILYYATAYQYLLNRN